jgi:hypothetical protein
MDQPDKRSSMDAKVSSWACTLSKYSAKAVDCGAMRYTFGSGSVVLAGVHKNLNNATKEVHTHVFMYVCMCV